MKMSKLLDITPVFEDNFNAINTFLPDGTRKYRYIINTGSSRSSKTFSLNDIIDWYARSNPNSRTTAWRKTKINCKQTLMHDFIKHHNSTKRYELNYKFNKTESIFKYKNGATIEINGADESNKVHGLTQDVAWLNEPYDITKEVFDQIDQRTADFLLIDWNPSMAHPFIDMLYNDPRTIVIHSTFRRNPFCPPNSKKKILSYQPITMCDLVESGDMTEQEARDYNTEENKLNIAGPALKELVRCQLNESIGTASAYNWSVYGLGQKAERPNRIFHWHKIDVNEYNKLDLKTYYGVDWGKVDPWGIVEIKYKDRCLYIKQLNYFSEDHHRRTMSSYDKKTASSMSSVDLDEGIVTWLFTKLKIPYDRPVICDNNRPKKIISLRRAGWDYAEPADGLKAIRDGIDTLSNLKVYFTSDSTDLDYEQQNYSLEKDRNGNTLDVPEDKNNHLIDPIRYVAQWLEREGIIRIL